jgi:hypothetical protein
MGAVEQVRELHEQVPRAASPQTMLQTVGSSGRALVGSGIVSASVVASAAVSSEDVGVQPARLDGDPTLWEVRDVAEWLRLYAQLSVAQVRSAIEEHSVACGLDLLALDDGDLHALGLTRVAERKQLLRMLAALRLRARRACSRPDARRRAQAAAADAGSATPACAARRLGGTLPRLLRRAAAPSSGALGVRARGLGA